MTQVSESDLLRDQVPTPVMHDSPQATITEEAATPLAEEVPLYGTDKLTMEVIHATKRILETIRLRDFNAYQYVYVCSF